MKKLFFILLICQFATAQSAFDRANKLYQQSNYSDAIEVYQSILKAKKHSPEIHLNLGNCYYKTNQIAPAIYHFEKALLLDPNHLPAQTNLIYAQKRTIDNFKIEPKAGFSRMIQNLTSIFHYNTWGYIGVGFSVLFFLFFVSYYYLNNSRLKRLFFTLMILSIVSILISIFSGFFEKNNYQNYQPAIVFAEIANVKKLPKSDAPNSFVIHEGAKVYILEKKDNYNNIELTDGRKGWILSTEIKSLK